MYARRLVLVLMLLGLTTLTHTALAQAPSHGRRLADIQSKLPAPGTVLIDTSDWSRFTFSGDDGQVGRFSAVDVEGRDFATAQQVQVLKRGQNAWDVQLMTPTNNIPIHKGDVIFIALDARALEAKQESGEGVFGGYLQEQVDPWTGVMSIGNSVGRDWKTYYGVGVADRDWDKGQVVLTFHLAQIPQTLQFGGLVVLNLGPGVDQSKLPYTEVTYAGRERDAPWRKAAAERIEKYRKGDLKVVVVDVQGRPVPDADVSVEMTKHAYGFGCFLEQPVLEDTPDGQRYREYFLKNFNKATTPVYWADWGWASPDARQRYLNMAAWLHEQKMNTRGHVLVWPAWRWMPSAIESLKDQPDTLRRTVRDHVREVVEAMKPYDLTEIDVMNEPRVNHDLMDLLGRDVMVEWFKIAHETDPDLRLFVNEYSIVTAGGKTEPEQEEYARTIQFLLDHGAPLGGIGIQGHMGNDMTPPARVVEILDRFGQFDLPIEITEFTVDTRDEQAQADYERDFMTAVFSHPDTIGIVRWGFWEGQIWIESTAQVRKDWSLKPNGRVYQDLVFNKWWTDESGQTDTAGHFGVRGFLGDYRITASAGGDRQTIETSLGREGREVRIQLSSEPSGAGRP